MTFFFPDYLAIISAGICFTAAFILAIVIHPAYGKRTMKDDLREIIKLLRELHHEVKHSMSLSVQLKASTDALTAAVANLKPPATDVTPDADVQTAITAVDQATATVTAVTAPPAPPPAA